MTPMKVTVSYYSVDTDPFNLLGQVKIIALKYGSCTRLVPTSVSSRSILGLETNELSNS